MYTFFYKVKTQMRNIYYYHIDKTLATASKQCHDDYNPYQHDDTPDA